MAAQTHIYLRFAWFRHVFCLVSFVFLACLRMSCSGMSYGLPACLMVALACFIFRHVACFASFVLLACLRMSCSGMFSGRSGMLFLLTCFCMLFLHVFFRLFHFHTHLLPGTGLRLCGRYGRQGRRHVYLPSSSPRLFRLAFLACLSPFFFRPAAFHTQLRPGAGLACGRYDRQGPTALEQCCAAQI